MHLIYELNFSLSALALFLLICFFKSKIDLSYYLLFIAALIANFGYMQLANTKDLNSALMANQIVYLGTGFTPLFLINCIKILCKAKIKRIFQLFFLCMGFYSIILINTNFLGFNHLYYKKLTFNVVNGIGCLVKEYGPLHTFYPLYLLVAIFMSLAMIFNSIAKNKDVPYTTSISLLLCMVLAVFSYGFRIFMHIEYELLPFTYTTIQIILLILLRRIRLYNITAISTESMVESQSYGFIIYNSKGRYLGCDIAAKNWFPELTKIHIDTTMKGNESDFTKQLLNWTKKYDTEKVVYFERKGRIIEAKHTFLKEKQKNSLHCVYLRDETEQQKYLKLAKKYNEDLKKNVNAKTEKIKDIQNDIIISMASIVENRDNNTGGHIARTSDVVKIFVEHLQKRKIEKKLTLDFANCIIKAAPLHDFGKIAIPDSILNKPSKFTDDEYEIMKKHSEKGAAIVEKILKNSDDELFKKIAINVANFHHEKWNGTGYPTKIKEFEIPFEARVMALADVFDALVSKRVYKDSFSYEKAFSIIKESSGTHFDPILCREFLNCKKQLIKLYNSYDD